MLHYLADVNLLTVNCLRFTVYRLLFTVILSYHISLRIIFVCFAGVSENPQMVKGEGLRVKGLPLLLHFLYDFLYSIEFSFIFPSILIQFTCST